MGGQPGQIGHINCAGLGWTINKKDTPSYSILRLIGYNTLDTILSYSTTLDIWWNIWDIVFVYYLNIGCPKKTLYSFQIAYSQWLLKDVKNLKDAAKFDKL